MGALCDRTIRQCPDLFVSNTSKLCYNINYMKVQVISLFPEMFKPVFGTSMLWKAKEQGAVNFELINLRDFGLGPRKTVDDTPYGGGDGMLLMIEPMTKAVEHAKAQDLTAKVYLPTPRGEMLKQSKVKQIAADNNGIILLCPRYEGYDERITDWVDEQFCVGPYVLTGGEIPAMILVDSVVRLIPGVLGGDQSIEIESFQQDDKTIEFPQYTRPELFGDKKVPDVLLSGNHAEINKWRKSKEQ